MTTRSRLLVLYMLCGLGIILTSILGQLFFSADHSPLGLVVIPIVTGLYILGLGGYRYLHPEKTSSSSAGLLGAATGGFLLVYITVVSLIHFSGITGESTPSIGYVAFMLFVSVCVSVWLLFSSFSLRRKERK